MVRSGRARCALLALAALVLAAPAGVAQAAGHDTTARTVARVAGATHVLLGPATFGVTVQQDPLAYQAERLTDGTVRGRWSYDYYEAGVLTTYGGTVTCLTVRGNRAWVGGPIERSSDPTAAGQGAWWQVADLGSGRHPVVPDRTTFVGIGSLAATQAYCDNAPEPKFPFDVQSGGVTVQGSTGP